ncbi:transposase InsO family protein [Bradyrhizobium sp. USDA 3311]
MTLTIERMSMLAGVSRAGYYRRWAASAPGAEETGVRDAIQRLALTHRHYGYRRISAQLPREDFAVNGKRVLRLIREDNLLCLRRRLTLPPYVERPARQELFQSISHIGTVRSYVRPLRAAQYGRWPR